MQRNIKILLLLLVSVIFSITFKVNASSNLVEVSNKASIRKKTSEAEQGLRFYASLDESIKDKEHGFYVIYGNASLSELNDAITNKDETIILNGKEVFKVEVNGVNDNNEFSIILIGIPEVGYADHITVFAYIVLEEEIISETRATRSVAEVALKLIDDPLYSDVASTIVNRVNHLIYYADFESSIQNEYIKNTETNFGITGGINWIVNNGSGVLYDYSDDNNITLSQGSNILRINGTTPTTLISPTLSSVTKLTLDAKHYKTSTGGSINVYAKGEGDLDYIKLETLNVDESFKMFEIEINKVNVSIKIEATGSIFNIDNIMIYGLTSDDDILKTYQVTFNVDDEVVGELIVLNALNVPSYEPTKDGYIFDGWYTDNNYLDEFIFNTIIDEDVTLYARFIKEEITTSKPPYINVKEDTYYVNVGNSFTPPTLTAYDDVDNNFLVTTSSYYDTNTAGEYLLSYVAIDSDLNEFEFVVKLYVVPSSLPPVPSGYPIMDEPGLSTIRNRWEPTRNGLKTSYSLDNFNIYNYYSSLENLEGTSFFNELKSIINVRQVSYGDVRFILEKSDLKHSIWGSYQYGIYDGMKLLRYWDSAVNGHSSTLNREHVWPRSYLGVNAPNNSTRNISSDIHNLRVINITTNSNRSNYYFVEGSGSNKVMPSNTYYPGDDHRGDVARIMFYMHVRYSDDLYLTNNSTHIRNETRDPLGRIPFGLLDVLLQWHKEDPVDDFEIYRNNVIYTYQGNRNPFIDNPDYADVIFNNENEHNEFILIYMEVFIDTNINLSDLKPKYEELLS